MQLVYKYGDVSSRLIFFTYEELELDASRAVTYFLLAGNFLDVM